MKWWQKVTTDGWCSGPRLHLVDEVRLTIRVAVSQKLDGDLAAQQLIFREVNLAESAPAQSPHDPVIGVDLIVNCNGPYHRP